MGTTRPPIGDENIDRYLDRIKGRKAEGTWKGRHSDLKHFHGWIVENEKSNVTDVTPQDIDAYLTQNSNDGYAPLTIERRYYSIRSMYKTLDSYFDVFDEGENPLDDFEYEWIEDLMGGPKKNEGDKDEFIHITPEEVDLMVEHAPKPRTRNQLMFRLMFQTGVRAQECRDIKLESVDPEKREISVYCKKKVVDKDSDRWRDVYYQPSLDTLMSLWLNQRRPTYATAKDSEYLFLTNRSEQVGKSRIQELVRETAGEAGIQEELYDDPIKKTHNRITPHAFRHGHCMEAVKSGIDIAFVREQMGHESLEMTKEYLKALDTEVQEAYKGFGSKASK